MSTTCSSTITITSGRGDPGPRLTVTTATPPRDPSAFASSSTSSQKNHTPRLLYRGALSLVDSNLVLDGLTFTISLPVDDPQASLKLMENPLPLALETLRGRPSLRFIGVERMDGLEYDASVDVKLHVHPRCILTYQLFAHHLCTEPITSQNGCTSLGIRIRLDDPDIPSTATNSNNDIIVYGRAHPSSSILQLCVGRILPKLQHPVAPKTVAKLRPPRPDDPTPRKPPVGFVGMARIGVGVKRPLAAIKENTNGVDDVKGKAKEEGHAPAEAEGRIRKKARKVGEPPSELAMDLGKKSRAVTRGTDNATFKVPPLPPLHREKSSMKDKGKAATAEPDIFDLAYDGKALNDICDIESRNKAFVKKAVVRLMAAAGVGKQHADFKEFFNLVYRGTTFALRAKMKTMDIDGDDKEGELVDRITQAHVTMYLGGKGLGVYLLQ